MAVADLGAAGQSRIARRRRQPVHPRGNQAGCQQVLPITDYHLVLGRYDPEHVAAPAGGKAKSLALPDREVLDSSMLGEYAAGGVHDAARLACMRPPLSDKRAMVAVRHEADFHA